MTHEIGDQITYRFKERGVANSRQAVHESKGIVAGVYPSAGEVERYLVKNKAGFPLWIAAGDVVGGG